MSEDAGKSDAGRFVRPKDLDNDNRTTLGARIMWRIEALAWDVLYWYPMKALPLTWASKFGGALLKTLGPLISQHRTMVRNLRMAFPEKSEAEVQKIARGSWETLGQTVGEMPHLAKLKFFQPGSRVEAVGFELLDEMRAAGKPAVMISGHFANWEVLATSVSLRMPDAQITYRSANNPHIDRRIAKARQAAGIGMLTPKGAGTRDLMRALSSGRSVALMNDQKFNQGIPVPLFGHDAMTAPGPTRLAMKYGAPLVPFSCVRVGPARYRLTVHEPFMPDADPDEDAAIYKTVLRINQFLEARIREHPEQWFWMHNRWPKDAWVKAGALEPKAPANP